MRAIFLVGTAGSGKSLLCSKLREYYSSSGAFVGALNLDPGVESLPYTPDVDIRDHIDIMHIMKQYDLGPNGGLVVASDMIATQMDRIQYDIDRINPDYLVIDTPGQIELFAYRNSGPFLTAHLAADAKAGIFLYDGSTINSAANFLSISLLAASIRLRLRLPCVNIVSKADLAYSLADIMEWSGDAGLALEAAGRETDGETYSLISGMAGGVDPSDLNPGLFPVSSATGEGLAGLEAALSRMLNQGEEVED